MRLTLKRTWKTDKSTIGTLEVDGKYECYTLEDVVRAPGVKVAGATAIPAGEYEVVVTFSNRFQRPLPLLLNVPNFEGVRIHPGNTAADTEGCILVGRTRGQDQIGDSKVAFEPLFSRIQAATLAGKVHITIEDVG